MTLTDQRTLRVRDFYYDGRRHGQEVYLALSLGPINADNGILVSINLRCLVAVVSTDTHAPRRKGPAATPTLTWLSLMTSPLISLTAPAWSGCLRGLLGPRLSFAHEAGAVCSVGRLRQRRAAGSGCAGGFGCARPAPPPRLQETSTQEVLLAEVKKVIRSAQAEVRSCYEAILTPVYHPDVDLTLRLGVAGRRDRAPCRRG